MTLSTLTKVNNEEKLSFITNTFNQERTPITAEYLKKKAIEKQETLFPQEYLLPTLLKLEQEGYLQQVYLKEGRQKEKMFIPLTHTMKYEEREWETVNERIQRNERLLSETKKLTRDDYRFFLYMIGSSRLKTKQPRVTPLLAVLMKRNRDYHRFVDIVSPYIRGLGQEQRLILGKRIGWGTGKPQTPQEVADDLALPLSRVRRIFKESIELLENLLTDKMKRRAK